MPIVAHGYGLVDLGITNVLVDDMVIALDAQPTVVVDDNVTIQLEADDIQIQVDADIEIEVE